MQTLRRTFFLSLLTLATLSAAAFSQATLAMLFEGMSPHIGQMMELRVVEMASGSEVVRLSVPAIPMAGFEIELDDLMEGMSYRIDFYADLNENGSYDAPPIDHAWRLEVLEMSASEAISFNHNTDFTDIAWPPLIDGAIGESEYRNSMMDAETGLEVFWENDSEMIYVGLSAEVAGYVAIGFAPERRMEGANIIIASISDGELLIQDHFGTSQTGHREDAVSDIVDAAGMESDGMTVVEFSYPLLTGNADDKPLEAGSEAVIILAVHRSSDSLSARHSARSTSSILLDE